MDFLLKLSSTSIHPMNEVVYIFKNVVQLYLQRGQNRSEIISCTYFHAVYFTYKSWIESSLSRPKILKELKEQLRKLTGGLLHGDLFIDLFPAVSCLDWTFLRNYFLRSVLASTRFSIEIRIKIVMMFPLSLFWALTWSFLVDVANRHVLGGKKKRKYFLGKLSTLNPLPVCLLEACCGSLHKGIDFSSPGSRCL